MTWPAGVGELERQQVEVGDSAVGAVVTQEGNQSVQQHHGNRADERKGRNSG